MSYKLKIFNDYVDIPSILEALEEARVFSVQKTEENTIEFVDACDACFGLELTKNQVLSLCDELSEMAASLED